MTESPAEDVLVLDRLTVAYRRAVGCQDVSFRVPSGTVLALLGRAGSGKSSVLACILGERKPTSGSILLCGADAWRQRRKTRKLVAALGAGDPVSQALARQPRLILLDDPDLGSQSPSVSTLRENLKQAAARGVAILIATRDASGVENLADRIAILRAGKLVLDDDAQTLAARFRRIRYQNEATPTRTEYGTELDLFHAERVRVRGWGIEAVVSNFRPELFETFRQTDGVVAAAAAPMALAEIFEAMAPEPPPATGRP